MDLSATSVVLLSVLVLPAYPAGLPPNCSFSSHRNVVKENLNSSCHAGSKGPREFNFTAFNSERDQHVRSLEAVLNATQEYRDNILTERLGGKDVSPERCLPIVPQSKDRRLVKAAKKIRQQRKSMVKDGLKFMQGLLRSYVVSVEMLVYGKGCLRKQQKVNETKYTQDIDGYSKIKQKLLETLCSYQQYGVDVDAQHIDTLATSTSCVDLNELDLEGYSLTKDIIQSIKVTTTQLSKKKRSTGRKRRRVRDRSRKRRTKKRRKNRRKNKSRRRKNDVVIRSGKSLSLRRKMVPRNKT